MQPFQSSIEIKFNQRLFSTAKYLQEKGIPVLAGAPLSNALDNFHSSINCCCWFKLPFSGSEEIIHININDELVNMPNAVIKINDADILKCINEECEL